MAQSGAWGAGVYTVCIHMYRRMVTHLIKSMRSQTCQRITAHACHVRSNFVRGWQHARITVSQVVPEDHGAPHCFREWQHAHITVASILPKDGTLQGCCM
eukprot:1159393-Pelagomonas_calceolata.AAC.6